MIALLSCCCDCCTYLRVETRSFMGYTGSDDVFTANSNDLGNIRWLSNVPPPYDTTVITFVDYIDGSLIPPVNEVYNSIQLPIFYTAYIRSGYDARYEYYLQEFFTSVTYTLVNNA